MANAEIILRTERLDLIAATPRHVEAELLSSSALAELLAAEVSDEWPPGEYDRDAQKFFRQQLERGGQSLVGWLVWYAVARGTPRTLVAGAGYFGPPAAGKVEIGYSVVNAARRKGYATEIVKALTERAFEEPTVKEIVAHTTKGNAASNAVLLACGFKRVGPGAQAGSVAYSLKRRDRA